VGGEGAAERFVDRGGNRDIPAGDQLPIPVPVRRKSPRPHPRPHSQGDTSPRPRPRVGNQPLSGPRPREQRRQRRRSRVEGGEERDGRGIVDEDAGAQGAR
jgi:hypothetical protein